MIITPDAVLQLLTEEQVLDPAEPLTIETNLFAAGLDSLALMQLLLHIEQRFGVVLEPHEITRERFETAMALAVFLNSKAS